ncbi:MAG TPA: isopentenyl phosphate kinase [Herpetosiphonaceae bacterium]|nr:isopentenyl phosphate kinase [Herpetosiphonaceae bacterium]
MADLIFLKLGGSVLTDKTRPEALDEEVLGRVAAGVVAFLRGNPELHLLVAHGGGSFGHHWASVYQTHQGVHDARGWEGVTRVADAMSRLNREVVQHLLAAGVNAISVQPSASALASGGVLESMAVEVVTHYLQAGLVPVLYGDVVFDRRQGAAIISTEALFAFLAPLLRPGRVVLAGEPGVYTADPRLDPRAQHIAVVDESNIEQVMQQTAGSHGVDVTGGMASKVATMWQLVMARDDLEVLLVGSDEASLAAALDGRILGTGTRICRRAER